LRPAFRKDGTITAGNASSLNDGAAAVVLAASDVAKGARADADRAHRRLGRARAGARVVHHGARRRIGACSTKLAGGVSDVDLWEINEAFAVVSLVNNRMLGLDRRGSTSGRRGCARPPDRRQRARLAVVLREMTSAEGRRAPVPARSRCQSTATPSRSPRDAQRGHSARLRGRARRGRATSPAAAHRWRRSVAERNRAAARR